MQFCVKKLGLVAVLSALALVAVTGASYAKEEAWLGVVLQPLSEELKQAMDVNDDVEGVLVSDVVDDSPADRCGLVEGDIIIAIDDEDTKTVKDAVRAIKSYSPGDEVDIVVLREGERERIQNVELTERDTDKLADLDLDFDLSAVPEIQHELQQAFEGWVDHPQGYLGVRIQDMSKDLAEYFDVDEGEGVLVLEVTEDSPAEEAGLKAGDVILSYDGEEVSDTERLVEQVRDGDPGDKVELRIKRKHRTESVEVELGETESPARFFVQKLRGPGEHGQIIMPRGRGLKIPDIDEVEIQKYRKDDLREEMEKLKQEMQELKKELKELRES
jgi:S1-C subfamily serine protease